MTLDELRGSLGRAAHTDRSSFRPEILRASSPTDAARMHALAKAGVHVHDEALKCIMKIV